MSGPQDANPFEALERIFHEPNRLAIVSALCAAGQAVPFTALRETCRLTDGNLNRHIKVLEEAGAVRIRKRFVAGKPRTTVRLTAEGLDRFGEYLSALNEVLNQARQSLPAETQAGIEPGLATAAAPA